MKNEEFKTQIEEAAQAARTAGQSVQIGGMWISVDGGENEYFFQSGDDLNMIQEKIDEVTSIVDVTEEDALLWMAQCW